MERSQRTAQVGYADGFNPSTIIVVLSRPSSLSHLQCRVWPPTASTCLPQSCSAFECATMDSSPEPEKGHMRADANIIGHGNAHAAAERGHAATDRFVRRSRRAARTAMLMRYAAMAILLFNSMQRQKLDCAARLICTSSLQCSSSICSASSTAPILVRYPCRASVIARRTDYLRQCKTCGVGRRPQPHGL